MDDEQLVARAQAGERVAFEELVRRHADRLHAIVLRLARDRHEAEEVTQEAFLRAWRGIRGFKGRRALLHLAVSHRVNEARRRAQRRPSAGAVTSLEAQAIEPRDPRPGPERTVERTDLRAALEAAVRDLDPEYRAPLVLRDIEGLSTAEAAAIMGLGEAALKSRLRRARLSVRAAVDSYLPSEDGPE
jgi:RNA polymerase sigma-70 factor (ECF subfamily)